MARARWGMGLEKLATKHSIVRGNDNGGNNRNEGNNNIHRQGH